MRRQRCECGGSSGSLGGGGSLWDGGRGSKGGKRGFDIGQSWDEHKEPICSTAEASADLWQLDQA